MYELVVCGPSGGGSVRLKFKGILQLSYFDKASFTEENTSVHCRQRLRVL